jgi:hypothetical protein
MARFGSLRRPAGSVRAAMRCTRCAGSAKMLKTRDRQATGINRRRIGPASASQTMARGGRPQRTRARGARGPNLNERPRLQTCN